MPNQGGTNQFAGFPEQTPAYGSKQRQAMLERLAPLAGKPVTEPRRASQDRPRPAETAAPAPGAPPLPVPPAAVPPAELFPAIASIPGASPLVQAVFGGAA